MADVVAFHRELDAERAKLEAIPGQQDIDGGEAPSASSEPVETLFPTDDLRVAGTTRLGTLNVGGKAPSVATLKIAGIEVKAADGQAFRKGERLHVEGVLYVDGEAGKDIVDRKTMVVTDAVQKHTAIWVDLVVSPAAAEGQAA